MLESLKARGVSLHIVTLHVGAGTFLPVKTDDTEGHIMHPEWGTVSAETTDALNAARRAGGRIVAAGSTSLRLAGKRHRRRRHCLTLSPARPRSSSRRATASAPWT